MKTDKLNANESEELKTSRSKFNKTKRIVALLLAILLVVMYLTTLFFAITDDPNTMGYFRASVALTIAVPVLIYAYQLVFRVMKSLGDK